MTFRQKLEMERPDHVGEGFVGGCKSCPWIYGYEEFGHCELDCSDCWNREIPKGKGGAGNGSYWRKRRP